jgi:hypothetical protein
MKKYVLLTALGCVLLQQVIAQAPGNSLTIKLNSSVFSDSFQLIFTANGNVELDDQDAVKVSEGYLSISSLHPKGSKLAIEERAFPAGEQEVGLFVKGYAGGNYQLKLLSTKFQTANTGIILFDKYLNKKLPLLSESTMDYAFAIDSAVLETQGSSRFSLLLSKVSLTAPALAASGGLLAFPNPFKQQLFLNTQNNPTALAEVRIKDLLGRLVWRKEFKDVQLNDILELECQSLIPGLYLLEWSDKANPKRFKTLKIIKQ